MKPPVTKGVGEWLPRAMRSAWPHGYIRVREHRKTEGSLLLIRADPSHPSHPCSLLPIPLPPPALRFASRRNSGPCEIRWGVEPRFSHSEVGETTSPVPRRCHARVCTGLPGRRTLRLTRTVSHHL